MRTTAKQSSEIQARLARLGVNRDTSFALMRLSRRMHSWNERLCNDTEVDETTGKAYRYNSFTGKRYPCNNLQKGLDAAVARFNSEIEHLGLALYEQGDPRGAALYVYSKNNDRVKEFCIESCYSSVGVAVY